MKRLPMEDTPINFSNFHPAPGRRHGFGVGPLLDLSMPAGLLGFLVATAFHAEWMLVPVCFLAALAQYALLGYVIDRFLVRRKRIGTRCSNL